MFSSDFQKFFEPMSQFFDGVYAFDKIPKVIKEDHFIICNTGDSNSGGEHWFVIHRCTSETIEVFDSLGISENKLNKLKTLKFKKVKKLKFNVTPVQALDSTLCGEYSVYFVYQRLFNKDFGFNQLMNEIFSLNYTDNSKAVADFLQNTT